jgi:hypothetical protein
MTGTPDEIVTKLTEYGNSLTGQSKVEFDDAFPHLIGLVKQNFDKNNPVKLTLSAYGSGIEATNGEQVNRECGVTLKSG